MDGQTEVVNLKLTQLLRAVTDMKSWEENLLIIEFAYNYCSHSTTGSSPSKMCIVLIF